MLEFAAFKGSEWFLRQMRFLRLQWGPLFCVPLFCKDFFIFYNFLFLKLQNNNYAFRIQIPKFSDSR